MVSNTVTLFCLLKGDCNSRAFLADIDKNKTISHLQGLIKEERKSTLERVDATLLKLYQVSIPIKDNTALQEAFDQLENQEPLDEVGTIDEVFPSPVKKHIHVIVKLPGKLFNPPFFMVCGNGLERLLYTTR
jgi:Crinkler effector protein N-terminal domain